jgi:hypothetical protein
MPLGLQQQLWHLHAFSQPGRFCLLRLEVGSSGGHFVTCLGYSVMLVTKSGSVTFVLTVYTCCCWLGCCPPLLCARTTSCAECDQLCCHVHVHAVAQPRAFQQQQCRLAPAPCYIYSTPNQEQTAVTLRNMALQVHIPNTTVALASTLGS